MGLNKDLKLQGNDFSNIATFLFVGLLCFEIPNSTLGFPVYGSCVYITDMSQFTCFRLYLPPSGLG